MFEKIKNNPIWYLAGRMWEFGKGRRKAIIISMMMSAVGMAAWMTIPLVMAKFIDAAQNAAEARELERCAAFLALSVVMGVVGWMFHGPSRVTEMLTAYTVRKNLQTDLVRKVTALPVRWHQANHSGETIDQVSRAASALADFTDTASLVLQIFARFIGAAGMMMIFMPTAGLIVTANAVVVVVIVGIFDRHLVVLYEEGNKILNKVAAKVQDYLTNIRTVISLRLEDRVVLEVTRQQERIRPVTKRVSILQEAKWFTAGLLVDLTRALTLFGFVYGTVRAGTKVEMGTLFALNEYLIAIGTAFYELTWRWGDLVIKATRLKAIEHIEKDYNLLVAGSGTGELPETWTEVRVENMTFHHLGAFEEELAGVFGVDVTMRRGKSYAIVGSSGSGKSTLLSLLRGLNRASEASVTCDGVAIPNGLTALSHETTLVPQDPEVFADTVLNNVTMGIEAPQEKVLAALDMAGFTDVLARLPKGLETNIAEKGVSLSGGEKQRLALARGVFFAFDGESKIILLDESTSGVDVVRERRIYEALLRHFSKEVVIATTHKFNLLPLFDEIIVMERGRVVEHGALSELLAAHGRFSTMWREYAGSQATLKVAM
jgi:ATP-binding cassette subfamily B protein